MTLVRLSFGFYNIVRDNLNILYLFSTNQITEQIHIKFVSATPLKSCDGALSLSIVGYYNKFIINVLLFIFFNPNEFFEIEI